MKKASTFASLSSMLSREASNIHAVHGAADPRATIGDAKITTRPGKTYASSMSGETSGYVLDISSTIRGMSTREIVDETQFAALVDGKFIGNAAEAFKGASITKQPFTGTLFGVDAHGMYEDCVGIQHALIDAPNASNLARMYAGCSALTDVSMSIDTAPADMHEMFMDCSALPTDMTDVVLNMTNVDDTCGLLRMFKGTPVRTLKVIYNGGEPPPFISPNLMGENLQEIRIVDSDGNELTTRDRATSVTSYQGKVLKHGQYTARTDFANGKVNNNGLDTNFDVLLDTGMFEIVDNVLQNTDAARAASTVYSVGYFDVNVHNLFDVFTNWTMTFGYTSVVPSNWTSDCRLSVMLGLEHSYPSDFMTNPSNYRYSASGLQYVASSVSVNDPSGYSYTSRQQSILGVQRVGIILYKRSYNIDWYMKFKYFSMTGTGTYRQSVTCDFNTVIDQR